MKTNGLKPGEAIARAGILLFLMGALTQNCLALNLLYTFTGESDGGSPSGLVLSTNGAFYGTAVNGGADDNGLLYRISATGSLTPLYPFTYGTSDGANPYASLFLGTNGNFYGTAQIGGTNGYGTIFQVTPSGTFTGLYSFGKVRANKAAVLTNLDGSHPSYALVEGTNGNMYGTTEEYGSNGFGTLFEMTYKGKVTVLYSFTNNVNGATPRAPLLLSGGNFYGTTAAGGSNQYGTIFEVTSTGRLTSLYSFTNGLDGATPESALIKGSDGNFYGTATAGGLYGSGTIFQITPAGTFTPWYSFSATSPAEPYYNPDGAEPNSLIQGADGNFYGTAFAGGANGTGTIFEITPAKVFTTLYSFFALNETSDPYYNTAGANPVTLLQGTNGTFYGTAYNGGSNGLGTFFSIGWPPSITGQPTNLFVAWHSNANFTVTATGALGLQWQFDNVDLPTGTNATLSLTNAQPTNAGYYQVVLTNLNGAVTSAVVSLSLSNVPVSFSRAAGDIQLSGGQCTLLLTNLTGQGGVVVDASSNLLQWTPIFTNPPAFGSIQVIDPDAANYPFRFYRAVIGP